MKKFICSVLVISLISALFLIMPTSVAAAETITDEALFMTYPTYLSNSEMDEGLAKAETAYYTVINSYSETDEIVAKAVTILSEGVDIAFKESLSVWGITDNYYESCVKKAAKKYMQSMLENENVLKKATKKVQDAYKGIKTIYSTATTVAKEELIIELTKVAAENDIGISTKAMDAYVKSAYESGTLKNDLDAIGAVNDLWKYVIEFSELHAIEITTLDLLMEELIIAGQGDSDLCIGLGLLKDDIAKDEYYILENYATKTVISLLSKVVDELIGNVTGSVHLALVKCCIKVFSDYVYVNAKADEITQAIMQTSFVSSIDICLSQYRLKFLHGTGTAADIETYESLYAASLSAREAVLNTCYDIAKITDKFSLGGDCLVWADNIKYTYTYDNYIKWCKEAVAHDIANAELDSSTGTSTITDALNEETIGERLNKISSMSLYEPNVGKTFNGEYNGAKGSLGFAARVFGYIFDRQMGTKVESRYNHILTNNKNVRVIGRLEEDDVTESALKDLFSNVRIGDIVLTSGQYDYLHAMVVVSVGEDGVLVYDCDSKYNPDAPEDMRPYTIQQYTISYKKMADAFSKNGEYLSIPGITVYRAVNKVNSTNSGSNLHYAEYDDSVNYIIEDGVLKGYTGTRTTLEIPEGVTKIGHDCFKNNKSIKYVYMPDTVTEIEGAAFAFCSNLQYINISNSISKIYGNAFNGCQSLKNITLPNSLKHIGAYCFYSSGLTSVNIPDSVNVVDWHAFEDCINLTTVTVGKGVYAIGERAFAGCDYLSMIYWNANPGDGYYDYEDAFIHCGSESEQLKVVFSDCVTKIPDKALAGCYNLTGIEFPKTLTEIGESAFASCRKIEGIAIPENVTHIGKEAFGFCRSLTSITIPENVTYIGRGALDGCGKLSTVYWNAKTCQDFYNMDSPFRDDLGKMTLIFGDEVQSIPAFILANVYAEEINISFGKNVTRIGDNAFMNCNGLKNLIIPDSVTDIGWGIIAHCSDLETLRIPTSLSNMLGFGGCSKLNFVDIPDENPYLEFINGAVYTKSDERTLAFIPGGREKLHIPKDCKDFDWLVFNDRDNLTEITVEAGNPWLSVLDGNLYNYDKTELIRYIVSNPATEFEVPEGVKKIRRDAFNHGENLVKVIIPDSVEELEEWVFGNCRNLAEVKLPSKLSTIQRQLFISSGIQNITIPKNVTKIEQQAFHYCQKLKTVTLYNEVTNIMADAFSRCENLTDVYYIGTQEDWNKITIESGNEYLTNATIHFIEEPDTYLPGDINGDGEVTTKDVTTLRRYIAGGYDVTVIDKTLDVNRDNTITTKDVTTLRRFIAGGYGIELE